MTVRRGPLCLSAIFVLATTATPGDAVSAPRLKVRAETRVIDAGVIRDDDDYELRGRLVDDLGNAVAGVEVAVSLGPGASADVGACTRFVEPHEAGPEWILTSNDDGEFCLRVDELPARSEYGFRFAGTELFTPLSGQLPLRPKRQAVRLSVDSPLLEAALDRPSLQAWVSADPVDGTHYGTPLRVVVAHAETKDSKTAKEVAHLRVDVGGRARLEVPTSELGPPGIGQIVLHQAGTPTIAPSKTRVVLRRVAAVTLSLAGALEPVDPSEGLTMTVGASSVAGAVPNGWVEATMKGRSVGVAPVTDGSATLEVALERIRSLSVDVTLQYVPEDPWWLSGAPLELEVPIAKPSPWRALPWLVAVCAIAYWVVQSWRRPSRRQRPPQPSDKPRGRADVEWVEADPRASGWTGHVVDAHDGTAIAGATVQIVLPAFDGQGLAAAASTTDDGAFVLEPRGKVEGSPQLRVTSKYHATLTRRLPPPGRLVVSITSRRRALLDRLVVWARAMGRPWTSTGEPTPGHVLGVAKARGQAGIGTWAKAVEEASFGPVPPDENTEQAVTAHEPRSIPTSEER